MQRISYIFLSLFHRQQQLPLVLLLLLLLEPILVAADWHAQIDSVSGQSFSFGTGAETGAYIKVEIYDVCRVESGSRTYVGDFYPTSTVSGITVNAAGVTTDPGDGNSLSITFAEGIAQNSDIYTANGGNTATVEFCAQVGVYYSSTLVNFAEVKLTYNTDLVKQVTELTGYTVSQSEAFTDAADTSLSFDGTLLSYFCNPTTKEVLTDDGSKTHQGSILSICFKAHGGQFEVRDVVDLTVKNVADVAPSQTLIVGTTLQSPTYVSKVCTDTDTSDTNICVVSFLLTANFYDYHALTLSGSGSVLLEFGDASSARTRQRWLQADGNETLPLQLQQQQRQMRSKVHEFTVKAHRLFVEPLPSTTVGQHKTTAGLSFTETIIMASALCIGALCAAALLKMAVTARARYEQSKQDDATLQSIKTNAVVDFEWTEDLTSLSERVSRHCRNKLKKELPMDKEEEETVLFDDDETTLAESQLLSQTSERSLFGYDEKSLYCHCRAVQDEEETVLFEEEDDDGDDDEESCRSVSQESEQQVLFNDYAAPPPRPPAMSASEKVKRIEAALAEKARIEAEKAKRIERAARKKAVAVKRAAERRAIAEKHRRAAAEAQAQPLLSPITEGGSSDSHSTSQEKTNTSSASCDVGEPAADREKKRETTTKHSDSVSCDVDDLVALREKKFHSVCRSEKNEDGESVSLIEIKCAGGGAAATSQQAVKTKACPLLADKEIGETPASLATEVVETKSPCLVDEEIGATKAALAAAEAAKTTAPCLIVDEEIGETSASLTTEVVEPTAPCFGDEESGEAAASLSTDSPKEEENIPCYHAVDIPQAALQADAPLENDAVPIDYKTTGDYLADDEDKANESDGCSDRESYDSDRYASGHRASF